MFKVLDNTLNKINPIFKLINNGRGLWGARGPQNDKLDNKQSCLLCL